MNQSIFKNHQQFVARTLEKSNHRLDIAVCWFSNPLFFAILLKKAKAGIQIRLILQFDQANFHPKGLKFLELIAQGGEVFVYREKNKLFHHKFFLVDNNILITGSYNWTRTGNADNLLETDHPNIIKGYQHEFEALWKKGEPLTLLAKTIPPSPAFHKLFEPILWNVYDLRQAILWGSRVWISVFKKEDLLVWEECLLLQRHFLKLEGDYFERNKWTWEKTLFEEWSKDFSLTKKRLLKNYCLKMKPNDVLLAATDSGILLAAGLVGFDPEPSHLKTYCFARYVQWFEYPENETLLTKVPRTPFSIYRESGLQVVNRLMLSNQKKAG